MARNTPEWMQKIQRHNPEFADMYRRLSERVLKDGAIPAKYKILIMNCSSGFSLIAEC